MTEAEWLGSTNPQKMLEHIQHAGSARKMRLFAVACCRRMWNRELGSDGGGTALVPSAVLLGEQLADRLVTETELAAVRALDPGGIEIVAAFLACVSEDRHYLLGTSAAILADFWPEDGETDIEAAARREQQAHCDLLRDLLGPLPFRPVLLSCPRAPVITSLANAAYEERILPAGTLDSARLAVLSDALEEAGCTNADLLTHLRSPGLHVRGCWALDLILGRS